MRTLFGNSKAAAVPCEEILCPGKKMGLLSTHHAYVTCITPKLLAEDPVQ